MTSSRRRPPRPASAAWFWRASTPDAARCSPPLHELGPSGRGRPPAHRPRPLHAGGPGGHARGLAGLGGARVLAVGDGAQRYAGVLGAVGAVEVVAPGLVFPPPASCSDSHWLGLLRENRQSSPLPSFLSTCVRRTHGATSLGRSGPEVWRHVTLRIDKLKRRDLRQLLRIESSRLPRAVVGRPSSTPSSRCARAGCTVPRGSATTWPATSGS